jgi:hypothetical protein
VHAAIKDPWEAPIPRRLAHILDLVKKLCVVPRTLSRDDVARVVAEGSVTEEEIYDAITVCALFQFYNTWVDGHGVEAMSAAGYAGSARRLAQEGYE